LRERESQVSGSRARMVKIISQTSTHLGASLGADELEMRA
jgi:hypothetical protein